MRETISKNFNRFSGVLRPTLILLGLLIPTLFAYSNALHGSFVFDDSRIYNSPEMRLKTLSPQAVWRVIRQARPLNRPIANLSFALNYYFHEYRTFGYHLVNLIIHLGSGILLFFIFRLTLALARPGPEPKKDDWLAWTAAIIWLVHPINSQAVSYTVQRMTSLAALFCLSSLWCYLQARADRGRVRPYLAGAVVLWLLALGSKENSILLPPSILLFEWLILQKGRLPRLKKALPWLIISAAALLAGALVFTQFAPGKYLAGGFSARPFTPLERFLTEGRVLVYYLSLLAWPHPSRLSLDHDFAISSSLFEPLSTLAAFLFILALIIPALRRRRNQPLFALGVLWFFLNHLLESTILPLDLYYEHRNYLPGIFICLGAVCCAARFLRYQKLKIAAALIVITILTIFTHTRNQVWQNRFVFWQDCVQKAPLSARAHSNFGVALKQRARLAEAEEHYLTAIRLNPRFTEVCFNLGNIYSYQGRSREAVKYYRMAAELAPGLAMIQHSLGLALEKTGELEPARQALQKALSLSPQNYRIRADLNRVTARAEIP